MSRLIIFFMAFALAACSEPTPAAGPSSDRPMRIISLDFCADQYVLKFTDPEQILAVSPDAVRGFSYMRETAIGVPRVRPVAEDVLIRKPDLVVRSYGGGPNAAAFFERAGVPVLQIGWASSVHGDEISSIPQITRDVAAGLGQAQRGEAVARDYLERLEKVSSDASGQSTLYMTPAGVTTGGGSLVHEALLAAGLENYASRSGWQSLPLERLAYERPDLVAAAYFDVRSNHGSGWSATRHPIAKRELTEAETVELEGAWLGCGGWFLVEAIEALAEGATDQ
ncbi:MAG: ABC transporter substrate-binding protein [Pseudomonadota bacterium]